MTAPARRTVPATAPQAPEARSYFPAPIYARHAPTLPPDEPMPGEFEDGEAVHATRPDTPHVRALRFLGTAGDLLAAFILIGGGMGLIGLATHL
ncbi:hypothetical protein [Methylobacterium aquaticum]|jgi:hypothetical protein|uniref:Uncharacterized protein n=1 Tax=Methylobacterium aquaticum TaxID=270351 RepID=A0A0J6SHS5_9HYPH|nr:hypothetical protein [Methylobacterium aquaticum]KMO32903.1 hypothetical protein VP06_16645 [Methylobacterium aquaticum]